jgi:copper chaperone
MSQTFSVTGLNCQSCVKHVTSALTALPDVAAVRVDLETGGASTVHVDATRHLADDEVQAALSEEGNYSLVR